MAASSVSCKLIVKHFPSVLNNADKEDLLKYFGAQSVVCMTRSSKMRDVAFAEFPDELSAARALRRLHQLDVLGRRLVVEYATKQHERLAAQHSNRMSPKRDPEAHDDEIDDTAATNDASTISKNVKREDGVASKLGLKYKSNPQLSYLYPPPTASILTNIAHTLACVPKFYTQVLHLMNRMNLPAPFGQVTPAPPIVGATGTAPALDADVHLSSEESEIESDEEEKERRSKEKTMFGQPQQAPKPKSESRVRKRTKLQPSVTSQPKKSKPTKEPVEAAFETPQAQQRTIAFNLTDAITSIFESGPPQILTHAELRDSPVDPAGGFGTFAPPQEGREDVETLAEEEDEAIEETDEFITSRELESNRMKKEDIMSMSSFKNYAPGEPTSRLYVKNLSRQADEKDLRYIFGRYVDFTQEDQKDRFDIRLMKEGRMKGQAFVTLPSEDIARRALRDVHGYRLHGKPVIIQYARSAKAKETK